jgi:hypothetical protein
LADKTQESLPSSQLSRLILLFKPVSLSRFQGILRVSPLKLVIRVRSILFSFWIRLSDRTSNLVAGVLLAIEEGGG